MLSEAEKRAERNDVPRLQEELADVRHRAGRGLELLSATGRFVDVREEKEQAVSMLPGAITEQEFLNHLERYRDVVVIGYCTISYRSGKLAEKLKAQGVVILNLRGGLLAWLHDGGKVYDRDGETRRIHVYGRQWDLGPKGYKAVW
jgi:sodium/bile acid cotransporter 7